MGGEEKGRGGREGGGRRGGGERGGRGRDPQEKFDKSSTVRVVQAHLKNCYSDT